jgi:hypothetical protein
MILTVLTVVTGLTGCKTVPDSMQEANTKRLEQVAAVTGQLTEARNEQPQVEVVINLPPGEYRVPESGWELAAIKIYDSLDLIGITALNQTDWQISENVAVTGLRVLAPLIGFLGGQYYTNQMHQGNTRLMSNIAGGSFGVASQSVATPPLVINAGE